MYGHISISLEQGNFERKGGLVSNESNYSVNPIM